QKCAVDNQGRAQPGEADPHHRVTLPDHGGGDAGILHKTPGGGVEPHRQILVVPQVKDIQQDHRQQPQGDIQLGEPAHQAAGEDVGNRQKTQQSQGQHANDGQPQIKAQADSQGAQKVFPGLIAGDVDGREADDKQQAQQGKKHEQQGYTTHQEVKATGL